MTAPVQRDGVSVLRHQVPVVRMPDAAIEQRAIVELLPQSPASRCYRTVASRLAGLGPPGTEGRGFLPSLAPIEEVSQCA